MGSESTPDPLPGTGHCQWILLVATCCDALLDLRLNDCSLAAAFNFFSFPLLAASPASCSHLLLSFHTFLLSGANPNFYSTISPPHSNSQSKTLFRRENHQPQILPSIHFRHSLSKPSFSFLSFIHKTKRPNLKRFHLYDTPFCQFPIQ